MAVMSEHPLLCRGATVLLQDVFGYPMTTELLKPGDGFQRLPVA